MNESWILLALMEMAALAGRWRRADWQYRKSALLLGGLLLAYGAVAQELPPTPAAVAAPDTALPDTALPDTIRTVLTARHRRVPGATFYVRPAAGYVPEESLNGLARPGGSLLEVVRVPGANFLKIRALIVDQYLADRGARVQEQHQLTFDGYPAVFGRGESLEPGKDLMMLAFGDSTGLELVFGLYPNDDAAAEAELRQMLLTGYYDPRGTVPPLELAPFVISLAGTPFQLQRVDATTKYYTFGLGNGAAADSFATRFTVQVLPVTPAAEARQQLQQLAQALTTPGTTLQSQERQLSPARTYEVSGSSALRGRKNSFYQVVKTDEDATLIFHGVWFSPASTPAKPAAKGKPAAKPAVAADPTADFRKVAATLRMKH